MMSDRVGVCHHCRTPSTADVRGVAAFRIVRNTFGYVEVCELCAPGPSPLEQLLEKIRSSQAQPRRSD